MCGRFSFSPLTRIIEERFDIEVDESNYKPSYNCAPSQNLAVISNVVPGKLSFFRWGLIPFWAKDPSIGNRLINARAETVTQKPSFKNSFQQKRCLVLSDGFYEWKKGEEKEKIPYRVFLKNDALFSMAGIWDTWKDAEGKPIHSFAIITTSPNNLMKNIHQRMPVILNKNDEKNWLENNNTDELSKLLEPYPSNEMTAYQISKLVNSPLNNSPEIIKPVNTL
ncbi:MAG: SOS response-associated peptidase [Bacteroidales bacterium]|nr:SOS response-associated peptidase [Bacteroidales bacterium]